MGSTYKTAQITRPGQSVFLATPAKERIKPGYAYSLAITTSELTAKGIPFELAIMEDNCHVDDGRNSLARDFLYNSQCTDMVFIDADLRWNPAMLLRLLSHDSEDIVAGAYPFKSYPIKFPVGKIFPDEENAKDGLLSVSYAPTGFMRIPRGVFEKLIPVQTKRGSKVPTHRFFERRYTVNTYDGGDVTFCRKWIAMGGKVLVDSKLTLEHIGEWRWSGCFLDHLSKEENRERHTEKSTDPVPELDVTQKQNPPSLVDAIQALRDGEESDEDFQAIADIWGNKPFAATWQLGKIAWIKAMSMTAGEKILECGSGYTSVILAIAAEKKKLSLTILEHEAPRIPIIQKWLNTYDLPAVVIHAPIFDRSKWYEYKPDFKPDFILIDGPPRWMKKDRFYPLRQPGGDGMAVLADDANPKIKTLMDSLGVDCVMFDVGERQACAGVIKERNKNGKLPEGALSTG